MSDATDRTLPVWRSALYVPSNVPKFIDGAYKRGADAIIVDLEDSVPIGERRAWRRRRHRAHQPAVAPNDARP